MFRFHNGLVIPALLLAVLPACGGADDARQDAAVSPSPPNVSTSAPVTPGARPQSVPETAQALQETTPLGRIERQANAPPNGVETRRLENAACEDDVLVLETSEETIYATLPCDRFWDGESRKAFVGEEVAIVLEVAETRFRVLIETVAGAQAEFTVLGIWVE